MRNQKRNQKMKIKKQEKINQPPRHLKNLLKLLKMLLKLQRVKIKRSLVIFTLIHPLINDS